MTFSYLPMERKLVLIYCMINILQSLTSLILSQIFQLVIDVHHRLRKNCQQCAIGSPGGEELAIHLSILTTMALKCSDAHPKKISQFLSLIASAPSAPEIFDAIHVMSSSGIRRVYF